MKRLRLADSVYDAGEYLARRLAEGGFPGPLRPLKARWVYYAPCHQREQGIGTPYLNMLREIPGLQLELVGTSTDCCGMGGSLGCKKNFYDASLQLGASLIKKIRKAAPEAVVTDCLSCRLQFQHVLDLPVYHPRKSWRPPRKSEAAKLSHVCRPQSAAKSGPGIKPRAEGFGPAL